MFLSLIRNRRSIRKYQSEKISPDIVETLVEAALRAPSSRGLSPWEFIVVDEPQLLKELAKAKQHGSSFLANAPLAIVVMADTICSDVWVEDAAIAATYIQLAAQSVALGSCWIQIRERMHDNSTSAEEYLRQQLNIPTRFRVECIIAIGKPDEELPIHPREGLADKKVFYNEYQKSRE